MTIIDSTCWERGCPCYDSRDGSVGIVVQKREWVGLTDDEIYDFVCNTESYLALSKAIEAKLKEKNT